MTATIKDKRLQNKLNQVELNEYLTTIDKSIPDISDKAETIEIEHDPIELLERIQSKKQAAAEDAARAAQTAEEENVVLEETPEEDFQEDDEEA